MLSLKRDHHPTSTNVIILVLAILQILPVVHSVIQPPHIRLREPDFTIKESYSDDTPPSAITILEGSGLDVLVDSKSSITVNLNRPQDVDVEVQVSAVKDTRHLITFDPSEDSDIKNNTVILRFEKWTSGDRLINFHTNHEAGVAVVISKVIEPSSGNIQIGDSSAFIDVKVARNNTLITLSFIVGWIYFTAWSLSFYTQVILNYKRKSVIGLNFDFLALNIVGFICYSIFYVTVLFSEEAQNDYRDKYPYSRIQADYNDLFFALHAVVLTFVTIVQCFIYERGDQKVSAPAFSFLIFTLGVGFILMIIYIFKGLILLDVIYYFSNLKLVITLIKYVPQAYMNYQRKATTGWSIHNILLDFTGGSLSILQMFFRAYNYNDWVSIFGNFTKFGLGVSSILFDILFIIQHYCLYNPTHQVFEHEAPAPLMSQSITEYQAGIYRPEQSNIENQTVKGIDREVKQNEDDS